MKKLLYISFIIIILGGILFLSESCKPSSNQTLLMEFPTDSIDVYSPLKPNEDWNRGRHTYGIDSIIGNTMCYRMASDSSNVYVKFDITLLELHPKITSSLLSFGHHELRNWGFVNEADTIPPFNIKELADNGASQQDIARRILDWESDSFYGVLPDLLTYEMGFNIEVEIYPVYLDEDYVTYKKLSRYYTGGAHSNYTSFLQTYSRHTGEPVDLEDIVCEEKMGKLREHVVSHMASKYSVDSNVNSVESYLESLNGYNGLTDIDMMGLKKDSDRERITVENYPLNDPGIHEAGLVFAYEKYHLTSGICGCPVILIPFDEIMDCLKEPFCNYKADVSKLVANKEIERGFFYQSEIDSIRHAWGSADDGGQWPRDIYDWYKYRHGIIKRNYPLEQIAGTWIGYGHRYDPRQILTIKGDGRFVNVCEEALPEDSIGEIAYIYTQTVKGMFEYDETKNKLTLKNWDSLPETEENIEAYVKQENPNNKYMIIHSMVGDTMYVADDIGDLWPFFRKSK